ncbi:MAG: tetratricopeptide repeat protein [Verrucomicrobiota bacterium]
MRDPKMKSKPASAGTSAPVMARSRFPVWLMALLLALVTIGLYWPATRCDFINYDDNIYVTENPHVQGGLNWEGVKWAFGNTGQAAYWAPMMWLSHLLACQLFGLNPWGHHLINVLLHAANTALVFVLLRGLTGATWRSLVVAALFGWHPLRVESVAWVTERKDVLSTCFGLLALIFYARYAQNKATLNSLAKRSDAKMAQHSTLNYILALFCFALGLMSKPMLVTWPFVMLLLDYWPLQRVAGDGWRVAAVRHLALEKLPFFGLAAVMAVVTFLTQKHGGVVAPVESLPLGARGENALISYCRYFEKLFWPVDLAVFYPHPGYWPVAQVLLAGGLMLAITVWFILARRRYPFLLMGWLWFCGTMVPVIQLVQSGGQAMADRFTYVPSLGVLVLAIWGVYELIRRWQYHEQVLSVAAGLAIILCLGLTRQQLGYWRNSETLFRHALAVTKNNYLAHKALGVVLGLKGQTDEAIDQFQEAILLAPDYTEAHYSLGIALDRKGQTDEAIKQFQEAVRLKPDYAEAHFSLGTGLGMKGQIDDAIKQFQEAIRLKPDYGEAHYNLGTAFGMKGQTDEAIKEFQEVIRLNPDYAEAHYDLGIALGRRGQTDEAIKEFQEAIRLKPDYAEAHHYLDRALETRNAPAGR